ncbi:MAG: sigma-54-dependent Fis family transcriptional regulator [Acidobacteria bacterium]|nr:sigma-54-dependent Fis family transcriptional regulator [Acidobacteriota bacterium]
MSDKTGSVIIIDDDIDVLKSAQLFLKMHLGKVDAYSDPEMLPALLKKQSYDVILLDMNFTPGATGGKEGLEWLDKIIKMDPEAVVILISAYGDVGKAVEAIKAGAFDFILKPWQNEKLLATINAAINLKKSKTEIRNLKSRQKILSDELDKPYHDFIGVSPAMKEVFKTIDKVAVTDANILILGENGTGKELVSRALHRKSQRADEIFVSVDMGSISESLFESELFGHMKGAFTDARENRAGRFEIASGGTLFLDEIGNLSMALQSKVLRVLETRQIYRVGSNKPIPIDIRLICATNMPILQMVQEKKFRQDLLYRINTVEIHIPPLRNRIEDISLLAEHFLKIYARKYNKNNIRLSDTAIKKLELYEWPGNVRELQHAIERAIIMSDADILQPKDFFFSSFSEEFKGLKINNLNLDDVEMVVVKTALNKHKGNISRAADELGLTRAALYRRMEKYDL